MAELIFRYSAMGAGKTLDLLKVAYNYEEHKKETLLFTSSFDDRYRVGLIKSRTGLQKDAFCISRDDNIYEIIANTSKTDCILVDEAQFLSKEQVKQLSDVVDYLQTPVICYGLRVDYRGEPFEGSAYLMALADVIQEIDTICHCGAKGRMNARIVNGVIVYEGNQVIIDKPDINSFYISTCRLHWKVGDYGKKIRPKP